MPLQCPWGPICRSGVTSESEEQTGDCRKKREFPNALGGRREGAGGEVESRTGEADGWQARGGLLAVLEEWSGGSHVTISHGLTGSGGLLLVPIPPCSNPELKYPVCLAMG